MSRNAGNGRALMELSQPKKDVLRGECRSLHIEKLNDLYSSPNIIRVIRSRIMRLAGHVARIGNRRVAYRVLVGRPERKRPLGRTTTDGRIILKWISQKVEWGERKRPLGRPTTDGRIILKWISQKVEWGGLEWITVAQSRYWWRADVNAGMNFQVL
jgi:hypothetical protein